MPIIELKNGSTAPNPKREQILTGAMQVFLQQGYEGTSMDRVAAAARVSKNTVYNHFQDKQGLFTALIEQVTAERFQIVFSSLPLDKDPDVVLEKVAQKVLNIITGDREYISFMRLLLGESDRFPELAQQYIRAMPQKILLALGHYFESHPELNLVNPEATARIFMSSLIGHVILQEVLHGKHIIPMAKEDLVESLISLIVGRRGSSVPHL